MCVYVCVCVCVCVVVKVFCCKSYSYEHLFEYVNIGEKMYQEVSVGAELLDCRQCLTHSF